MEELPRQVYTRGFRLQAVELVTRGGLSLAEASRRLSLSRKAPTNRVRRAKNAGLADVAPAPRREVTGAAAELSRRRRQARPGYRWPAAYTRLFTRQQGAA